MLTRGPIANRWQSDRGRDVTAHLLCRRRVNHRSHLGDAIGRKASLFRVFPNCGFAGGDVHAVDLVIGDVAVEPLDLRPHALEHVA